MKFLLFLVLIPMVMAPAFAQTNQQILPTDQGTLEVQLSHEDIVPGQETGLRIDFINPISQKIQEHIDYRVTVSKDAQDIFALVPLTHTSKGSVNIPVNFGEEGMYKVDIEVEGILFQPIPIETVLFDVLVGDAQAQPDQPSDNGGGCLIATAAFGSELAPHVQQLRELRDNTILETESGTAFMAAFNQVYYSFSPHVADLQREHPVLREAARMTLTPMLLSLSMLDHADIESEQEMIGYGISIILLNVGMYVGIPLVGILKLYQLKKHLPRNIGRP